MVPLWILAALAVTFLAWICRNRFIAWEEWWDSKRGCDIAYRPTFRNQALTFGAWTITLLAWLSPIYYEFPSEYSKVVKFVSGEPMLRPFGAFCIEGSGACVNIPRSPTTVKTGVTSLTTNPKVRTVHYEIETNVIDIEKYFAKPERRNVAAVNPRPEIPYHTNDDFTKPYVAAKAAEVVSYHLFRFNADNSTTLAAFDNPLDTGQHDRFRQLIEGYLNSRLAKDGLKVSFKRFSVT